MALKKYNRKVVNEETFTLHLSDTIYCRVKLRSNKLDEYTFYNTKKKKPRGLTYVADIAPYILMPWFDRWKSYGKEQKFSTVEELEAVDISNLYYFDDRVIYDNQMKPISSLINIGYITVTSQCQIRTPKKAVALKTAADKLDYVKSCKIVEIPSYNRDKDKHSHTCELTVLLPQDEYEAYVKQDSNLGDQIEKDIVMKIWATADYKKDVPLSLAAMKAIQGIIDIADSI